MIKKVLDSNLPLILYPPTGVFSPSWFDAAAGAGALPVLDGERLDDARIMERTHALARSGRLIGLRLAAGRRELLAEVARTAPAHLTLLVVAYAEPGDLDGLQFDRRGLRVLLETVDIGLGARIDDLAPDGVIVRGNEAPGRAARRTAFILQQWYLENTPLPVFVHGGVGWHTAAGMLAAGASGLVLDDQLYLAAESGIAPAFRTLLERLEENDSVVLGQSLSRQERVFAKLGTRVVREAREKEVGLDGSPAAERAFFESLAATQVPLDHPTCDPLQALFPLGQDAVFARHFILHGGNALHGILHALCRQIGDQLAAVALHDPLRADAPLAREHGTRYPIMQGPMANVSDSPAFAARVLAEGGLPFFAMGSLPAHLAEKVLSDGSARVERFGAGLIGIETFNATIRQHTALVKQFHAPFALFAGGVPSQVQELEAAGTRTYLHTPSMRMLDNAIAGGCSRIIFEGGEAGGHVGVLTSLVLWETGIERLLALPDDRLAAMSVVFAGGIGTASASRFVSGMSAALAARGARVGVQVGTAYLFTREIVESGAVKPLYQEVVCRHDETVLMGTSVGLASRTAPTPFATRMLEREQRRLREGQPLAERKHDFEKENIGSLLIGAKAFCPDFSSDGQVCYQHYGDTEQLELGNFMVGEGIAFTDCPTTVATVHATLFETKEALWRNLDALESFTSPRQQIEDEIAIVGMGCVLPGAGAPEALWQAVLSKTSFIREMPEERLDPSLYYSPDRKAEDRSYSRIAGVVADFLFDGAKFGYSPEKAARLSRSQQMVLEAAWQAAGDAGYLAADGRLRDDMGRRAAVVVATCLGNEMGNAIHLKYHYPELRGMLEKIEAFQALTPEERERLADTLRAGLAQGAGYEPVHGTLLNIEASRIARHLGIEGANYVVDAACATSFAAIDCAVRELRSGDHDLVVVGGVNTNLAPESFVGFSKMGALSASGSFPFDARADGFVLGEGAAVFVLKRLRDAHRAGDRILGVIKGIGASSDGKGRAIAAPSVKGQKLALERCFAAMRTPLDPGEIDYVEAHGTATVLGDRTEVETLRAFYGAASRPLGISSIKSQMGHLLGAAGSAGLAKALLALSHKTLPPNGPFESPAAAHELEQGPLFVIREALPWPEPAGRPRRAAVSSYGFGGINYHLVVEEHRPADPIAPHRIFPDPSHDFSGDRVVVAGMGVVLPGAANIDALWRRLEEGTPRFAPLPAERFDNRAYAAEAPDSNYHIPMLKAGIVEDFKFDNARYRIPPLATRSIDRAQLFALEACNQAIADAGLSTHLTDGNRVGVILGTIPGGRQVENILRVRLGFVQRALMATPGIDREALTAVAEALMARLRQRLPANSEDTIPGLLSNIVSGRVANYFNCNGANFVVDASCASSAMALSQAVKGLRAGDFDCVLTGGVDANLYPAVMLAFKRLGLLADGEPRFFDRRAGGYVMAEGAAVQVLTTYRHAKAHGMPIYGEVKGVGFRSGAPGHLLSPSEKVYREAIGGLYDRIGARPGELDYLDVFGVSNVFLDAVEKQAVESVFSHALYFGNAKPELGYFKAANPAVVLTRLMLMLRHRTLLPHHSYSRSDSLVRDGSPLRAAEAPVDLRDQPAVLLAADLHGVGGNHGHLLVGTLPRWLEAEGAAARIPAVAGTLAPALAEDREKTAAISPRRLVALLSGQGAQQAGMLRELYEQNETVRRVMDQGEALFKRQRGTSLLDLMAGGGEPLNRTENTQPAIFLASAALFTALAGRGFAPDRFIGHSVGEYTALHCVGALPFEAAMQVILARSEAMRDAGAARPGKIMVVFRGDGETETLMGESGIADLHLANRNSDDQTAVSGTATAVTSFGAFLEKRGVTFRHLALSAAFHSPLMQPAADRMAEVLARQPFAAADLTRIIANVNGLPFPGDEAGAKALLVRQLVSPVAFTAALRFAAEERPACFVEVGPGRLLLNLLRRTRVAPHESLPTADGKTGEALSFQRAADRLKALGRLREEDQPSAASPHPPVAIPSPQAAATPVLSGPTTGAPPAPALPLPAGTGGDAADPEFERFLAENGPAVREALQREFLRHRREQTLAEVERFNFYTGRVVIAGTAVGLPGSGNKVFNDNNFDLILAGTNFIEPLSASEKEKILDLNITRVFKDPQGNARLVDVVRTQDVIQLAGKLGYFNLQKEYGIPREFDITNSLAIAAGLEALKDADIPLVPGRRRTASGAEVPDGWALPEPLRDDTGVIMTSLFPGFETLIDELNKYYYNKFYVRPYKELEMIYYHLMQHLSDEEMKGRITDWFFKIKERRKQYDRFNFERDLLFDIVPLGSAHFARLIQARGPNIQMSGACASTTQAVAVAEDWIRTGRCARVIVIGGEASTTETQGPWIGSGFLALGAATIKGVVSEAAKPFDAERNGTILGSGAVALIVERADRVAERGLSGQAEVLGTYVGNSAYHPTRIDVEHLTGEMKRFVSRVEAHHGLRQAEYAPGLIFMSHETFTPARGGSASAEVSALKATYPAHYRQITITNTKGYTGHTLGAAIEDAVLVKALQKNRVPPVANLTQVPPEFTDLNFDPKRAGTFNFGLHYSAGFGSHFSFLFLRRLQEMKAETSAVYRDWLAGLVGGGVPQLSVVQGTLRLEATGANTPAAIAPPALPFPATTTLAPTPAPEVSLSDLVARVQAIVAEGTGYGVEMLGPELDLEADLGIDTVKQVELFGRIAGEFGLKVPEDLKLRELSTIALLAGWIAGQQGPSAPATVPEPAAAGVPAAISSAPAPAAPLGDMVARVQAIVAEGTGYGVEMLGPELDLEADLGIDTVKQVELFGRIAGEFGLKVPEDLKLRELSTIALLAGWIAGRQGPTAAAAVAAPSAPAATAQIELAVRRYGVRIVPLAQWSGTGYSPAGRTILITCDRFGVAASLAAAIRARGGRVLLAGGDATADLQLDFEDPPGIGRSIDTLLSAEPELCGLIHLAPLDLLRMENPLSPRAASLEMKSFFTAVQRMQTRLDRPGGLLALLSCDGVITPYREAAPDVEPLFAGFSGLMKSVRKELPAARVKVVEIEKRAALDYPQAVADAFLAELESGDSRVEVALLGGARHGLQLVPEASEPGRSLIAEGDRLLVTGGARGITFAILEALCRSRRLDLTIIGRSDPAGLDGELAAAAGDQKGLMALISRRMAGEKPVAIRRAVEKVQQLAETVANLRRLEALGSTVSYRPADVAEPAALAAALADLPAIDGVIHAAGVEESRRLADKTLDSFGRVFDTKVLGAHNLLAALEGKGCRLFVAFSSVTARLGNAGQSDYTAANDMLGRIVQQAAARNPRMIGKVLSWTAWQGAGMAERESVRQVLGERGLTFLPLERGVRFFLEEMADPRSGEAIFTAADPGFDPDGLLAEAAPGTGAAARSWPFIDAVTQRDERSLQATRELTLERDLFLLDHSREGVPIFLGATGIEAMAEGAQLLAGDGLRLTEVADFAIPYGIKLLKGRPKEIVIDAAEDGGERGVYHARITSRFRGPGGVVAGEPKLHYRGTFRFAAQPPVAEKLVLPPFCPVDCDGPIQDLLYHPARLFMDGLFRTVEDILSFDGTLLVSRIVWRQGREFFRSEPAPRFVTAPVVVDAMFQTGGMLEVLSSGDIVLPSAITRMRLLAPPIPEKPCLCLTRRLESGKEANRYRLDLVDPEGNLLIQVEEFTMVKIDRLAPEHQVAGRIRMAGAQRAAG